MISERVYYREFAEEKKIITWLCGGSDSRKAVTTYCWVYCTFY